MIHCDEVFDILTRGPFPTGAPSDGIVESHLNHCETCRQLAEALRPAIELLQEAIAPEECGGLPRYGGAAADSTTWFERDAAPLKTKRAVAGGRGSAAATRSQPTALPWRSAARFTAAACIGLALAGMLRQLVVSRDSFRDAAQPVAVAAYWRPGTDGRQWAAHQGLSDRCLQELDGFTVAAAPAASNNDDDILQLACCLTCHSAGHDRLLPATRVRGFVQACQACH
jgi:hypothetical protein